MLFVTKQTELYSNYAEDKQNHYLVQIYSWLINKSAPYNDLLASVTFDAAYRCLFSVATEKCQRTHYG